MSKFLRIISVVLLGLILLSGTAIAYEASLKSVTVMDDGQKEIYRTSADTVEAFLAEQNITISKQDEMDKELSEELFDEDIITIKRAVQVTIYIDSVPKHMKTTKETVGDLLQDLDHSVDYILLEASEKDKITTGMALYAQSKKEKEITETEEIPFESVKQYNDQVLEGTETVLTEGVSGEKEILLKEIYVADVLTETIQVKETVVKEPVNEVIEIGTKKPEPKYVEVAASLGDLKYSDVYTMTATAYTRFDPGCTDYTATGLRAERGVVAVDPRVIPLGSKVYIEGYGVAIAADTGGAIKGQKIDLCYDSLDEAYAFGRRQVTVYLLED